MKFGRRRRPLVSVVVPVFDVEDYLPACLDSVLAQTHDRLDVVVVDDGATDSSGAIADRYAARDRRVRVVHIENRGLGAARNEGLRHTRGEVVAFADSDDVVPPTAYAAMLGHLEQSGSDLVVGSVSWWEDGRLRQPPWMRRLHDRRRDLVIEDRPELLGDVFAWNKLFRRSFWDGAGLSWLEGHRYEDQPTTTRAYLAARRIGIVPDVVYHWRIRSDGSSITQQRASLADLEDRWTTKRMTFAHVEEFGSATVSRVFSERVLPGDLPRYFRHIPGAGDAWLTLLEDGVREFWPGDALLHTALPPAQRLTGWLVGQGRREDAALVMSFAATIPPGGRLPRVVDELGPRLDVPGLDPGSVERAAIAVRDDEV